MTPTIVFDLDGTLVHTVPDIAAALDIALERYSPATTNPLEAVEMMGDGLATFFWRGLAAKQLHLPAEEAAQALQTFLAVYSRSPATLSRAYPGIRTLLEELRESGVRLAVCTNKNEPIALTILEELGIRGYFHSIVGYREGRPKKPDPIPLLEAIERSGGDRGRALMIGDSAADSGAAGSIGIPVILVTYGYCAVPVRSLPAHRHVDDAFALRAEVLDLVGANAKAHQGS